MEYSASENESLSEVETLRQQLTTYKMINADLSKKIQELKVELSAFRQENTQIKNELLNERTKAAEYRRHFRMITGHCVNFINNYVTEMQQIGENDLSLIEGIQAMEAPVDNDNESPSMQTLVPIIRNQRPQRNSSIRLQLQSALAESAPSENNLLNTIVEESILPMTSTPIVSSGNIPKSEPRLRNVLPDFSPSRTSFSEIPLETPKIHLNVTPRRLSDVSQQAETDRHENDQNKDNNNEEEAHENDITEQSSVHQTVRECRIALSPLKSNILFHNITETRNDSSDWESVKIEETTKENKSKLKSRKAIKRKSSEGRPRRAARPSSSLLTEPSLRTKLRRGSDKKKSQ